MSLSESVFYLFLDSTCLSLCVSFVYLLLCLSLVLSRRLLRLLSASISSRAFLLLTDCPFTWCVCVSVCLSVLAVSICIAFWIQFCDISPLLTLYPQIRKSFEAAHVSDSLCTPSLSPSLCFSQSLHPPIKLDIVDIPVLCSIDRHSRSNCSDCSDRSVLWT